MDASGFDRYARDYDGILNEALAVSGEDRTFFSVGRIGWLARRLARLRFVPQTVMDYGCGTGDSAPHLLDLLKARKVVGVDVSLDSLEIAHQRGDSLPSEYFLPEEYEPRGLMDLVYCNGVLHHMPPSRRSDVASYVAACLRPAGILSGRTTLGIPARGT
jgi:SAM-dependent methyltransferase